MDRFSALQNEVITALRHSFSGERIEVVGEFPGGWRRARPRVCTVAVGLGGVELPAALGGEARVRLRLRFDILCPSGAETGCRAVFHLLCDTLTGGMAGLRAGAISCGEITGDELSGALLLTAEATAEGLLAPAPDRTAAAFRDIELHVTTKEESL